jgi:hypothetical protein
LEEAFIKSAKPQSDLARDRYGRFSEKSSNSSSFSNSSTTANSSPGDDANGVAAGSKEALPFIESPPLVRHWNGRNAKGEAGQRKTKRNPPCLKTKAFQYSFKHSRQRLV